MTEQAPRIIVCGAGVIGASIAFHLTRAGAPCTIVERVEVAAAASGKSGGFLALSWNDRTALEALARRSFALHRELATETLAPCNYGYRALDTLEAGGVLRNDSDDDDDDDADAGDQQCRRVDRRPAWLDGSGISRIRALGSTANTAQVSPKLFTRALIDDALARGSTLRLGAVESVEFDSDSDSDSSSKTSGRERRVTGVVVDGERLAADIVVLALGPWSGTMARFFPVLRHIGGAKANSIVMQPAAPIASAITAHAIFLDVRWNGSHLTPEIYPRPSGEVYVCGNTEDDAELPPSAADVQPNAELCRQLKAIVDHVSSPLRKCEVAVEQACFLPMSAHGPLMGQLPDAANAFVAAGHSCWGILNAPATGEALAALIIASMPELQHLREPAPFPHAVSVREFDPRRVAR